MSEREREKEREQVSDALLSERNALSNYSVMSQTAFGQTAADGIIVHDNLLGYLIACSLVCQSAHLQNVPGHLETEDRGRNRAVLIAPQQHVAPVQSAETHVHANLFEEKGREKKKTKKVAFTRGESERGRITSDTRMLRANGESV